MNQRHRILVTAGLLFGILVSALDHTIVDTAFPRIIADLGGVAYFTWVITAYLLASTAVLPVVGKLADIYGRRAFYLGGMTLFIGGSLLCATAQSMAQLIAFRALQGIGAGMLMPVTLTIIGDLFPGEKRAKMQGLFSGVFALGTIAGPKLGGWITHHIDWRWVFYINLPIGLIALALILTGLQESRGERRPVDVGGAVTVTGGVALFLLALLKGGQEYAWLSWQIGAMLGGAIALLTAFTWIERRAADPIIDFRLFANRTYATASLLALLVGMGMFGSVVFVPWFIQGVVGVNPSEAGGVMTPMMLAVVVCSILGGKLATRLQYRTQIGLGLSLVAAGFWLMTGWGLTTTSREATGAILLVGSGLGLAMPLLTIAVQNAFSAQQRGQVTATITFFRATGGTLGLSLFGLLFNQQMGARFTAADLPGPVAGLLQRFADQPQAMVQLLLREDLVAGLPEPLQAPVVTAVKELMSGSLQTVFWAGTALLLAGVLVAQFLGTARLHQPHAYQR